ncbi:hypothetical protein [Oceanobacillus iheyensis HTE831]|uniref:Uncharacterized protein n=1 Tax=Oceanobacillus iheyensis (strain DSM 14371 / CIP 107618 / JCM 11309 / KCTC 3954 / HTE831) TaxID=221109 RepID=Q8EQI3_OCEIH|nr:hypothetical protein [Oceanobacillus iheyensis HTE831]
MTFFVKYFVALFGTYFGKAYYQFSYYQTFQWPHVHLCREQSVVYTLYRLTTLETIYISLNDYCFCLCPKCPFGEQILIKTTFYFKNPLSTPYLL